MAVIFAYPMVKKESELYSEMNGSQRSKTTSLTGVTIIYAVGNLASKIISFVLFFVLTYFLTKENLGLFDIILTTAALVSPVLSLQLSEAIMRWLLQDSSKQNTTKVFTNIVCTFSFCAAIFAVIYWGFTPFFNISNEYLIFLLLLFSSILPTLQMMVRGNGKNLLFAGSGVLYSLIYTSLSLLMVVRYGMKVDGLLIGSIAASGGTAIFIFIVGKYYKHFDSSKINIPFIKELATYSIPLIPNAIAWWLYSSVSRYAVLYYLGLDESGIWASANKIPTILVLFNSVFFMAWQEKGIREYNNPNRDLYYSYVLDKYIALSLGMILVLTAAAKPIMHFAVEKSFFISWQYTTLLLMGAFFQTLALFYGVGYLCGKETKLALHTTIIGSVAAAILNSALVPILNLFGAGIATIFGFIVLFIIRMKQTKRYFSITFPISKTFYLVMIIVASYVLSFSDKLVVQVVNNMTALIIAIYINREIILSKICYIIRFCKSRVYA